MQNFNILEYNDNKDHSLLFYLFYNSSGNQKRSAFLLTVSGRADGG